MIGPYRQSIEGLEHQRPAYTGFERAKCFPEYLADWLNRNRRIFLIGFSVIYLISTAVIASRKFLWADEVLTAYMARLSLPQLWAALKTGVDIEPPLFHLITRIFTGLFGPSLLALRLPAILGGWLMCISLYLFVSRRLRPLYGAVAMLIPFVTGAVDYTYEARCYGIALGFAGAALVCWQGACEGRSRRLSLAGLAVLMAAAIACQYYMVLVLVAIGFGEVLRSVSRARIDWPVWAALTAAIIPLPLHLPLIRAAMTFRGGSWSAATPRSILLAYEAFFTRAILPMAAIVASLAIWECFRSAAEKPAITIQQQSFRPSEIGVALVLGLSIAGAFLVARLTNGIFTLRYGICLVFGAALLPLPAIRRYDAARPIAGALCLLILAGSFVTIQVMRRQNRFQTPSLLLAADPSSAIAIESPLDFIELVYNAPSQIGSRLYYLTSREESIRYTGTDDDERGLLLLCRWFPVRTEDVNEFLKHQKRILIWRGAKERRWLLQYLIDQGATTTLQRTSAGESLFLAQQRRGAQ